MQKCLHVRTHAHRGFSSPLYVWFISCCKSLGDLPPPSLAMGWICQPLSPQMNWFECQWDKPRIQFSESNFAGFKLNQNLQGFNWIKMCRVLIESTFAGFQLHQTCHCSDPSFQSQNRRVVTEHVITHLWHKLCGEDRNQTFLLILSDKFGF